jgi:signal transduction histidine kinase
MSFHVFDIHWEAADLSLRLSFALLLLISAPATVHAQLEPPPRRVLIVFAHNRGAPGVVAFADALKAAVSTRLNEKVVFYEEYLETDRFDDSSHLVAMSRHVSDKYRDFRPDAIVAEGTEALQFTLDHLGGLFPRVPIVYGNAYEPILDFNALPEHVTGIRLPLPFAETFALARALQPEAKRVVVVAGAARKDSLLAREAVAQLTPLMEERELRVLQNWTYKLLLDSLRHMTDSTIVILSSFRRDQSGYEFNTADLIPALARAASVPLYGIARNWVGDGVVGGAVMDFGADGQRAGEMLVTALRRSPGGALPPAQIAPTPVVVDWRQMTRWRLARARLPGGTQILSLPQTLWQEHGLLIAFGFLIIAGQTVLISTLLLERARRKRAQRALEDRVVYEQMMASLTTAVVRVAPEQAPRALDDAVATIGRFAGASAAVLNLDSDPYHPASRLFWFDSGTQEMMETDAAPPAREHTRLEVVLVADDIRIGSLELFRSTAEGWPGETVKRVGSAADVLAGALARERAARSLEQARSQVAHLARVATMGELAAAVTHELRQPLTAIRANAEAGSLLAARTPEGNDVREIFLDIVRDEARAAEVIEHIAMLVRKQEPVTTSVDLNATCQRVAQLLERDVRSRGARVELHLDTQPPVVSGDPVQLQQVFINLVLNALDAASSSARHDVIIGTSSINGRAEVFVRDYGAGLKAVLTEQLFEPFYSTKPHGLGMGLAIVRNIVARHHGTVRAENAVGGGAMFRVSFPLLDVAHRSQEQGLESRSLFRRNGASGPAVNNGSGTRSADRARPRPVFPG